MDFLNHPETARIIQGALQEDLGEGDHSSLATIPAQAQAKARCLIKGRGILAGLQLAQAIFQQLDPRLRLTPLLEDGATVKPGDLAFYISGPARSILSGERVVLNCMQRMSGIATQTHQVSTLLAGSGCQVLDTRKTTPLIRHMEKWAVHIGGGTNHRFGLYDMIMIKDNHIDFAGGIPQAIEGCHRYFAETGKSLPIVVETRNLEEVQTVLATGGITRVLLDNMSLEELRAAVALCKGHYPTEASGGITLENARSIAETGVDFISMGALTHSVISLDISLKAE